MQISIIIPAFNAANYLDRCIESISHQDLPYDCYEAIVINDGSTDDSVELLNALCSKYSFLRYVTTVNGGLSRARNRGITEASGENVLFVDADDCISPNVLGAIYREMTVCQLDMMLMNYLYLSPDGATLDIPFKMDGNSRTMVSGKEFLFKDSYPPMVWIYAYRRAFLLEKRLEMLPIWHEDEEFTPRAIYFAERIKYDPILFYNYFRNRDSYMNCYQESNLLYLIEAMGSLHRFKVEYCKDRKSNDYFDFRIAGNVMGIFKGSIRLGYQNQSELIKRVREVGIHSLKPKKKSFYYFLFNISPVLFEKYYRLIKWKFKKN